MCYRKTRRRNPVMEENRTCFDKFTIKTPCCSCPSCRRVKANDWLVRSYFEFLGNHRQAFFVSLDFDDEHLPMIDGQPCFDSQIMRKFLKRLRNTIGSFRYFYSTDFGGFLKRPHYHIIILPSCRFTLPEFFSAIKKTWQQGHYTNVECVDSVHNDKLKALQYVVSYSTKDITFTLDKDIKNLEARFRPRVQASKGFGLRALEEGIITPEMIKAGKEISLPVGRNGKLVKFPIPRYYEMKYCYDYYINESGQSRLRKNEFGVEVSIARHNADYVHYLKSIFASRWSDVDSLEHYNEYFSLSWRNLLSDVFDNFEDFKEFVYYRPFIRRFSSSGRVATTLTGDDEFYRPAWHYYESVCQVFDKYKASLDAVRCKIETDELVRAAKFRARRKLQRNPRLVRYLRYKNFDFSLLN